MDDFKEYPGENRYGEGILLDEYNGSYSLILANKKGEEVYKQWCYPQKKDGSKEPIDKSLPWKIKLGDSPSEAIEMLRFFASKLAKKGV